MKSKNKSPTSIEIAPGLLCGDLDAGPALKIFENKSVEDVVSYLLNEAENPYDIFEYFYFMSSSAFLFYFPIFEKYISQDHEKTGEIDEVFIWALLKLIEVRKVEILEHNIDFLPLRKRLDVIMPELANRDKSSESAEVSILWERIKTKI